MSERLTNTGSSVPSQPPGSVTGADSADGDANSLAGQAVSVHKGKKPAGMRAKVSGMMSKAGSALKSFAANFGGKKPSVPSELPTAHERQGPRFSDFYSTDGSSSETSMEKYTKLLFEDTETAENLNTGGAGINADAAQRGTEGSPRFKMDTLLRMQEEASEYTSSTSEAQGDAAPVQLNQDDTAKPSLEIRSKLLQKLDPPAGETTVTDGTEQVTSDDADADAERRRDSMELDAFLSGDAPRAAHDESEQYFDKMLADAGYDLKKYWGDEDDDGPEG